MKRLDNVSALLFSGLTPKPCTVKKTATCEKIAARAKGLGSFRAEICAAVPQDHSSELLKESRRFVKYPTDDNFVSAIRIVMLDETIRLLTNRLGDEVRKLSKDLSSAGVTDSIVPELEKVLPIASSIFDSDELRNTLAAIIQSYEK